MDIKNFDNYHRLRATRITSWPKKTGICGMVTPCLRDAYENRFFTIVLDGMPWLPMQLAMMQRLKCDWLWAVAEGVADNVADTGWCKKIPPRLSNDGTGGG